MTLAADKEVRVNQRRPLASLVDARAAQSLGLGILTRLTRLPLLGPWLHHPVGVLGLAAGRPDLAADQCSAALRTQRAWTRTIHRHLGKAQLGIGRLEAAEQSLRRAAASAPADRHNRLWLAETLLRRDLTNEAEGLLRGLLDEGVAGRWPHLMLIQCLLRQRRADAAIEHLIAAATRSGAHIDALPFPPYLLSAPVATRDRAEALAPILKRHPEHRELATFQARLLTRLGDYGPATRLLRRASGGDVQGPETTRLASRTPPTFLIIGQAKAGTTALFDWLSQHPRIAPPLLKEIHYWSRFADAGMDWYLAHFPPIPAGERRISGEASTDYLTSTTACARIAQDLPNVRLICLLREPVARAYSEYRMFVRLGWEQRAWEQAVKDELAQGECPLRVAELDRRRMRGGPSYLLGSAALPYLERWSALFPPSRLLIIDSAELFADPAEAVGRVLRYLGLPEHRIDSDMPVNPGHYPPMAPELARRLRDWFVPHQQALQTFLADRGQPVLTGTAPGQSG